MRRVVALCGIAVLISGCVASQVPERTVFKGFDFREPTRRGFLFTPEPPLGSYESVGLLTMTVYPALRPSGLQADSTADDEVKVGDYIVRLVDPDAVVRRLYMRAVEMGADAITNFRVDSEPWKSGQGIDGVKITGFAVKRVPDRKAE